MPKAAFSSAKSSMVMAMPSSQPAPNVDLRALSQSMQWRPIGLASKTWLKTKCFTESSFVVVGTDRDRKTGAPRALLAHLNSGGMTYAGAAFIALAGDERAQFFAEVERLAGSAASLKSSRMNDVRWGHPKLTVEVKHLAGSKTLRHATVRGFA